MLGVSTCTKRPSTQLRARVSAARARSRRAAAPEPPRLLLLRSLERRAARLAAPLLLRLRQLRLQRADDEARVVQLLAVHHEHRHLKRGCEGRPRRARALSALCHTWTTSAPSWSAGSPPPPGTESCGSPGRRAAAVARESVVCAWRSRHALLQNGHTSYWYSTTSFASAMLARPCSTLAGSFGGSGGAGTAAAAAAFTGSSATARVDSIAEATSAEAVKAAPVRQETSRSRAAGPRSATPPNTCSAAGNPV